MMSASIARSRRIARLLACLVVLAIATPLASAQPRAPQDRREAVKKKIRALRAYTLTEELALDEKTAAKLFPVLAKWDDVTDKLLQQRADLMRRLSTAAPADARALDRLIDEAVANQKAFWELEEKRLAELRKILTAAQTATLIVVLPAFERRIQNQLRRAITRRGAPRRAASPDDDADDAADLPPIDTPRRRR